MRSRAGWARNGACRYDAGVFVEYPDDVEEGSDVVPPWPEVGWVDGDTCMGAYSGNWVRVGPIKLYLSIPQQRVCAAGEPLQCDGMRT